MKCPSCDKASFFPKKLNEDIQVLECTVCGGYWLQSFQYWLWRERLNAQIQRERSRLSDKKVIEVSDSTNLKRCPECNKLLARYLVGKGTKLTIERCETCRGIWFDKNEWERLESTGLTGEIHKIFSVQWQKKAREESVDENRGRMLEKEVGQADFARIVEFKDWLQGHQKKMGILAYLNLMTNG